MNQDRIDRYYLAIAGAVALRSSCRRRKVGAILVADDHVIAAGYNGTPRGATNCDAGGCARCADDSLESGINLDRCVCVHAEQNAIAQAAYHGTASKGSVLYTIVEPCLTCFKLAINAGVVRIVYDEPYRDPNASLAVDLEFQTGIVIARGR